MSAWNPVNNLPANFFPNSMVTLTDGSILILNRLTVAWYRLTPDQNGNYEAGNWTGPFNMNYTREFLASGILDDGRFWVLGGEFGNDPNANGDTPTSEIFDPQTSTWTLVNKDSNFSDIQGDAACCTLPDGRVIFGALSSNNTAIWDPESNTWIAAGTAFGTQPPSKVTRTNEETWNILPDGTVITIQTFGSPTASQKYIPSTDLWVTASTVPVELPVITITDANSNNSQTLNENGPAIQLPDGRLFAIGASGATAFYAPPSDPSQPGTWAQGPNLPVDNSNPPTGFLVNGVTTTVQTAIDAPCCILPNGKVVLICGNTVFQPSTNNQGQIVASIYWSGPTNFVVYDPIANSMTLLDKPAPNSTNDTWTSNLMITPSGRMMWSSMQNQLYIYTPDPNAGSINDAWRPTVTNIASEVPNVLAAGHSYTLSGNLLCGISQGSIYGDDSVTATNYPLVRVTNSQLTRYFTTSIFSYRGISKVTDSTIITTVIQVPQDLAAGSYELYVVANGIPSQPFPITVVTQDCFITTERNSFSSGEITTLIAQSGAPATINPALFVVVEGYTPAQLQLNANNLDTPPFLPTIPNPATDITFKFEGPVVPEDSSLPNRPQRFTFPFQISFASVNAFDFTGDYEDLPITATLNVEGLPSISCMSEIRLLATPDPYILHGVSESGNDWVYSVDIRVFQIKQGETKFTIPVPSGTPSVVATNWIQQVISAFNSDTSSAKGVFDALPTTGSASTLSWASADSSNTPVYNFVLARVHLQSNIPASNVRVFFRLFPGLKFGVGYNSNTLYRSYPVPQPNPALPTTKVPLLGVIGDEIVTIPFFATPRVDTSKFPMTSQRDTFNALDIAASGELGGIVDKYFGAWLDINQAQPLFPQRLIDPSKLDGPYVNQGQLFSIQQLLKFQHQCVIAEIEFDPDGPITANSSPATSDKLAQRNLSISTLANPGLELSRQASHIMEIRPSPSFLAAALKPDELMIEWDPNLPEGTTASLYVPAVMASSILKLQSLLYFTDLLSQSDANTITFRADTGVTYIPIPSGTTAQDFVSLLSLQLPLGIRDGQLFNVTVRQITRVFGVVEKASQPLPPPQVVPKIMGPPQDKQVHVSAAKSNDVSEPVSTTFEYRQTLGIIRAELPVSTKAQLLLPEQRLLSVLKFAYQSIDITSRWWLVAQRYLGIVEGRVSALGGDPTLVLPDPTGNSINGERRCPSERELEGIICCLEYDRRGRFAGFELAITPVSETHTNSPGSIAKKHTSSNRTTKQQQQFTPALRPIPPTPKKKSFRECDPSLTDLLEKCWQSKTIVRICFHELSRDRCCVCDCRESLETMSIQKVVLCETPRHDGGVERIEIDETETVVVKAPEVESCSG